MQVLCRGATPLPSLVPRCNDHRQGHAAERDGCCTKEPLPGDGLRRRHEHCEGMAALPPCTAAGSKWDPSAGITGIRLSRSAGPHISISTAVTPRDLGDTNASPVPPPEVQPQPLPSAVCLCTSRGLRRRWDSRASSCTARSPRSSGPPASSPASRARRGWSGEESGELWGWGPQGHHQRAPSPHGQLCGTAQKQPARGG